MKIAQKIGKIFLSVIVLIIAAWALFTIIGKLVNPTKYPTLFGYSEAEIVSGSMKPTLSQGDYVIFHKQTRYALNDVVVFYDEIDGVFVVHRIVGKNGDKFIMQGDFNPVSDINYVNPENIQGKVIFAIENLQPFLYIGVGSLATILIQILYRYIKRLKTKGCEKKDEEQDIKNS